MPQVARQDREAIIHDAIIRDRAQLAETVEALARKADIKGRAHDAALRDAKHVQDQVQHQASEIARGVRQATRNPFSYVIAAFVVLLLIGWRLLRH